MWLERPPRPHLVDAAVKNVKHLLELRHALMEKMLDEFVAGVDIYLMHVRDANDEDAIRYQVRTLKRHCWFSDMHFKQLVILYSPVRGYRV